MITHSKKYDVIVIGAGHAGCEAALAAARMGHATLLVTMNLDSVAQMSCNPAIGGIAKGHMVREIDALGGQMARVTDATAIQFRMLNTSKGPAVWAPRAQCDKKMYHMLMKQSIEAQPNLELRQAEAVEIDVDGSEVRGVVTHDAIYYGARTVIVTTGTFLNGLIHIGKTNFSGGRGGEKASHGLSECLKKIGFDVRRLKTGTPPRINGRSIDFAQLEAQHGDADPVAFSFRTKELNRQQMPCYITYTNQNTHDIIRANLNQSPLYAGSIKSRGPRYCPSIEDKIVRFADKQRHQLFLEPEGIFTEEYYINGLSTSFPQDIQLKILRSIQGLENAEVMRYAYAIEYDYCDPTQIKSSLETKKIAGLFFAGQINGTSGYEEAAGQGIMAGINAALKIQNKPSFILGRSEAYIGVMIDDLVTNGTEEPYRMFTSRAEHRLLLRQDNANERLMRYGFQFGLIDNESYEQNLAKIEAVSSWIEKLKVSKFDNISADKYLKRSEIKIDTVLERCGFSIEDQDIKNKVEIEIKYSGYVQREIGIANRIKGAEEKKIPENFEYSNIKGIRVEAREKFEKIRPISLGQATRISGITPCDIALIAVFIEKHKANLRNSK